MSLNFFLILLCHQIMIMQPLPRPPHTNTKRMPSASRVRGCWEEKVFCCLVKIILFNKINYQLTREEKVFLDGIRAHRNVKSPVLGGENRCERRPSSRRAFHVKLCIMQFHDRLKAQCLIKFSSNEFSRALNANRSNASSGDFIAREMNYKVALSSRVYIDL